MKSRSFLLLSVLLVAGPVAALAGTWIQLSTTGPGRISTYAGGGRFDAKVYTDSTSTAPSDHLLVTCVDFLNVFSNGSRWEVNLTKLDGSESLANTRYGGAVNGGGDAADFDHYNTSLDALSRYQAAAWLTTKLADNAANALERKAIQGAIWYLLDPVSSPGIMNAPVDGSSGWTAARTNWLNAAITTGLSQNAEFYSRFRIVSQVGLSALGNGVNTRYQEFITTVTPEPAAWAALALAIVACVAFSRRRSTSLVA